MSDTALYLSFASLLRRWPVMWQETDEVHLLYSGGILRHSAIPRIFKGIRIVAIEHIHLLKEEGSAS